MCVLFSSVPSINFTIQLLLVPKKWFNSLDPGVNCPRAFGEHEKVLIIKVVITHVTSEAMHSDITKFPYLVVKKVPYGHF